MWQRNISMAKNVGTITTIKFFLKEIGKKFFGYYVLIFLQSALRAALDPIAEYNVYNHFNTIVKKKTTIYISHRLSACKFADKIAVINEGKLEEYGTHAELMKRKGIYYTMYQTQAQYYADVH